MPRGICSLPQKGARGACHQFKNTLQQQRGPEYPCGNVGHTIQQLNEQDDAKEPSEQTDGDEKLPALDQRIATKENKS